MADTSTNFFIPTQYSPSFDITWSLVFQFNSTDPNSTGGFSTFLFNDPSVIAGGKIVGGGKYSGLAYAPYLADAGVNGAVLGVMVTNDGKLILKGKSFTNLSVVTNILTYINIKSNTLLGKNPLTIRCNLTNVGQTINISLKDPTTDVYKTVLSTSTGITIKDTDFYKVGFGYSSPLASGEPKTTLTIKDIHTQGSITGPTTKVTPPPFVFPTPETYYIIQSPSSGKIAIGIPDPIDDGYLLHK